MIEKYDETPNNPIILFEKLGHTEYCEITVDDHVLRK